MSKYSERLQQVERQIQSFEDIIAKARALGYRDIEQQAQHGLELAKSLARDIRTLIAGMPS